MRGLICPWLVIKAVSTGTPSVKLLHPCWSEVNPRNTSVLDSECVLVRVDVNRQDEGKSAHLCLWFNVDLPAISFSSSSSLDPTPPPPPHPLLALSLSLSLSSNVHSHSWQSRLTKRWTFSCIDTQRTMTRWLSRWLFVQLQFRLYEFYKQLVARDHFSPILLFLFSTSSYSSSFSKPKNKTDIKLQSKERI